MAGPWRIPEEARALLGRAAPPEARPPVTLEQVQRYCCAVDDLNPLYLDEAAAARGPHGGIVAPPLFYSVPSFRPAPLSQFREDGLPSGDGDPLRPSLPGTQSRLMGVDVEFFRPIRPGDVLTRRSRLADLFEKQGRSGPLLFSVRESQLTNQQEELVCVERSTTAASPQEGPAPGRFAPEIASLSAPAPPSVPPVSPQPRYWQEAREGETLPQMARRITALQVFLFGAVKANSHLIHYDRDYALHEGLPERVAHGDLLWDFLCQMAVRWMGPLGGLRRFSCENRGPAFIGEEIMQRGRVTRRWMGGETGLVALELWSETPGGRLCLRGSATVALPIRP